MTVPTGRAADDTPPDDPLSDDPEVTVVASVEEVDAEIRAKLTGQSVARIADQAETAFASVDVRLSGEQLAAYADAVSTGSAFAIEPAVEPAAPQD